MSETKNEDREERWASGSTRVEVLYNVSSREMQAGCGLTGMAVEMHTRAYGNPWPYSCMSAMWLWTK